MDNVARHRRCHCGPDGLIARIVATRAWRSISVEWSWIDTIHPTVVTAGKLQRRWRERRPRRRVRPLAGDPEVRDSNREKPRRVSAVSNPSERNLGDERHQEGGRDEDSRLGVIRRGRWNGASYFSGT